MVKNMAITENEVPSQTGLIEDCFNGLMRCFCNVETNSPALAIEFLEDLCIVGQKERKKKNLKFWLINVDASYV